MLGAILGDIIGSTRDLRMPVMDKCFQHGQKAIGIAFKEVLVMAQP